jgi:hypothetical protein
MMEISSFVIDTTIEWRESQNHNWNSINLVVVVVVVAVVVVVVC